MEKRFGKIKSAVFGLGGYQDSMIGLHLDFGGEGWGVSTTKSAWDSNIIKHTESCQWTEEHRDAQYSDIVRKVSDILKDAKVDSVSKLIGKPVEITFDGTTLKDWRILTEVI